MSKSNYADRTMNFLGMTDFDGDGKRDRGNRDTGANKARYALFMALQENNYEPGSLVEHLQDAQLLFVTQLDTEASNLLRPVLKAAVKDYGKGLAAARVMYKHLAYKARVEERVARLGRLAELNAPVKILRRELKLVTKAVLNTPAVVAP